MAICEILEDNEQALLFKYDGKVILTKGPKRLWLIRSRIERLQRFTAERNEYLKIRFKDGKIEHRIGPCDEFFNKLIHLSITVEKCYCLNANQAIIIYKLLENKKESNRRIEYGPGVFLLQPDEWTHKFSWHGRDDISKTRYLPNKKNFEILNVAPNQLYYNVEEVRTSDDALIKIKLMIFYELKNVEKMLNETKDPIADLINFCCSDVISFTSKKTYLSFIENCHKLNDLNEYGNLVERAKVIGFEVQKVVFRGYFASPLLESIHNNSVQKRTELKLEYESKIQENELRFANLKNRTNRLKIEQELELKKLLNKQELEKIKLENELNLKREEFSIKIENEKQLQIKELEMKAEKNSLIIEHLKNLTKLNIDPNNYLLSSLDQSEKVFKIVKNTEKKDQFSHDDKLNIHFHE